MCYLFMLPYLLIYAHNIHAAVPIVQMTLSTMMEDGATFHCSILAEPEAIVILEFGNETLTSGEKYTITNFSGSEYYIVMYTLEIMDLMVSDTGDYWCVATNSHGSARDGAMLQVLGLSIVNIVTYECITTSH